MSYDVALTNGDGLTCNAAPFQLSQGVPSGWGSLMTPATLTLAPGATGHATLAVSPPLTPATGSQAVSVTVSDSNMAEHTVSATGILTRSSGRARRHPV